ncbi:MAG TPA: glycosyltransferase family 1 protein [Candidatus Subteraquimicrobiales bacterium]
MNIGVNICPWGDQPAGLSRYTNELVKSLAATGMPLRFYLFTPDKDEMVSDSFWQTRICWEQRHLPNLIKDTPVDVFHAPIYVLPLPFTLQNKIKTVVTVHDVTYSFRPQDYSPEALAYLNLYVPISLRMADHVIAVSESARAGIIEYFRVEEEKITVIPLAPASQFVPKDKNEIEKFRKDYGLPEEFILNLGSLVRRKNLLLLLEAYAILKEKEALPHQLVVAGGDASVGTYRHEILRKISSLNLEDRVILTDYFPDYHLPLLFSAAKVFVYPSLYEGFGLPPLEAMACGTPVITSNVSSLPEVVGNAAIKVSPTDPLELAQALEKILGDESLRENLKEAGLRQAANFSWRNTARETLKVYQKVMAKASAARPS